MNVISNILPYIQIVLAVLLTTSILLQQSGASIGGAFGGSDNFSSAYHTRRGAEKILFTITIVLAVLFVASTVTALLA